MSLKSSAKSPAKSASVTKGRQSVSGEDKEIALAAGHFVFAYELWLNNFILDRDYPSGVDPLNHERYSNTRAQELAVTAELYDSLPVHLRDALTNENRRASFKRTVSLFDSASLVLIVLYSSSTT
jgi:hypothetical protein